MSKVVSLFNQMPRGKRYWLVFLLSAVSLMFAALYFQYILEQPPCLMCIQVRIWLVVLIFVSIFGLLTRTHLWSNLVAQSGLLVIAAGLVERSYMLLGTERGFVFSDCGFDLGLPDWLAIDAWFPRIFQIETTCGYTPEIMFGITMAETLMALSVIMCIICGLALLASLMPVKSQQV